MLGKSVRLLALILCAGSAHAGPETDIVDFFLDRCGAMMAKEKLVVGVPGFKGVRLKDHSGAKQPIYVFAHPDQRFLINGSVEFHSGLTPIFQCGASNLAPARENLHERLLDHGDALLEPRARFDFSQEETSAILREAHDILRYEFDYDPDGAKILAVNGTRYFYEGCLGGKEVTVAVGELLGRWFISAKTKLIDRGRCKAPH